MVLLKKGDPNACRIKAFEEGHDLTKPFTLEFTSHPGLAMIEGGDIDGWLTYMLINDVSNKKVLSFTASKESRGYALKWMGNEDRYIELPGDDLKEHNVLWLRTWCNAGHSGHYFNINTDGTLSPASSGEYVFGLERPDKTNWWVHNVAQKLNWHDIQEVKAQ